MPRSPGHVFCDRLQKPLSEAGRIIAHLVARGAIGPVPICAAGRGHGASASQQSNATPAACPRPPGQDTRANSSRSGTLFVNVRPDASIEHFTAHDRVVKGTIGRVSTELSATSAKSLLGKLITEAPFAIRGIQVDGGGEFKSVFEQ